MSHIVLLGDSIFDNAAYVPGGPDVVRQLRDALPPGWRATLLAVDGATTGSVRAQLDRLPGDATHLVVSAGGNDALGASGLLYAPARSVADAVATLAEVQDAFEAAYGEMLGRILAAGLPTALCTIYDTPGFAPDHRVIKAALSLFNDRIARAAFANALPLVDLRLICCEDDDYANPIEPSVQGGAKIAQAISRLAAGPVANWNQSLVIASPSF
ncbi:MAG TPA: SGNH/GDSL hydrolase family protein [Allosphingosinicella sp.]